MLSRREVIAGLSAFAMGPALAQTPQGAVVKPGEDGLYHFDWYLDSFLDLAEDLEGAAQKNKRLAIFFSQRGCIYCKRMAEEHFSQRQIVDYVRANFDVLHFDLFGAREVTDFDGKKFTEKALAQRYGVRVTPTFIFFPERTDGLAKADASKREVARMPGLLEPGPFLAMFRFVREKGYENSSFNAWLKAQG